MSHIQIETERLLTDANVLIDLVKVVISLLELVVKHVAPVYVLSPFIMEVEDVDGQEDLREVGVSILDPSIEDMSEAAGLEGSLSYYDWLCFLIARRD